MKEIKKIFWKLYFLKRHILQFFYQISSDIQKFKVLWNIVPNDCKISLLWELIFDPEVLRDRFEEEVKFQYNIIKIRKD